MNIVEEFGRISRSLNRPIKLISDIVEYYGRLSRLLNHLVKMRIRLIAPVYAERSRLLKDPFSLYRVAQMTMKPLFPGLSSDKLDIVVYYLVCCVGSNPPISCVKAAMDGIKGRLDGMNEMSEMTSLRLQMTMDRRSKFIETLSNIMKKIGTIQDISIQNIK